jgi:hypothetical protein
MKMKLPIYARILSSFAEVGACKLLADVKCLPDSSNSLMFNAPITTPKKERPSVKFELFFPLVPLQILNLPPICKVSLVQSQDIDC